MDDRRTGPETIAAAWYPGRACLLGEHCDWAGGASLAVPLPLGVGARAVEPMGDAHVSVVTRLQGSTLEGSWGPAGAVDPDGGPLRFVPAAVHLLHHHGLAVPPTRIEVESDLPTGQGFSSSAAFTLTVLDVLTRRAGRALEAEELANWAFAVEHDLLGVECGLLDPLACAAGAPVFLRWHDDGYEKRTLQAGADVHLLAVAVPAPRDTRTILAVLNERVAAGPGPVRSAIGIFGEAAEIGAAALVEGDAAALGDAMNRAQDAYERLLAINLPELRAPGVAARCKALRRQGAIAAKFSGAGGEGSIIALYPSAEAARSSADVLAEAGLVAIPVTVAGATP